MEKEDIELRVNEATYSLFLFLKSLKRKERAKAVNAYLNTALQNILAIKRGLND